MITIELLKNPTGIKLTYDKKENRTLISYDSDQTKHDGCYYSVPGKFEFESIEGRNLTLKKEGEMKALSVKQPWASLICKGIKDIENRTWSTKYRGRILIHSSQRPVSLTEFTSHVLNDITFKLKELEISIESLYDCPTGAIIGSVEIVDCVINHSSIWAEKSAPKSIDYLKQTYNWVLANPILFDKPIENVNGKLSLWDYELDVNFLTLKL